MRSNEPLENNQQLERYLHEQIPLSAAMGVRVAESTENSVVLTAPLEPNINHQRTAFGGSISNLAILACWSFVNALLQARQIRAKVVIQRQDVEFTHPITGGLSAESLPVDSAVIDRFLYQIQSKGKGRISMQAEVRSEHKVCATFSAQFVALAER